MDPAGRTGDEGMKRMGLSETRHTSSTSCVFLSMFPNNVVGLGLGHPPPFSLHQVTHREAITQLRYVTVSEENLYVTFRRAHYYVEGGGETRRYHMSCIAAPITLAIVAYTAEIGQLGLLACSCICLLHTYSCMMVDVRDGMGWDGKFSSR